MQTSKPVLVFDNVVKSFGGDPPTRALNDLTFQLPTGSFAAIEGPSGSGKTTLLNLASGMDRPDSGKIWIEGELISELSQSDLCLFRRDKLGFVFQAYNLFPVLTALENVEYTSLIRGDDRSETRKRALRALDQVGLSHKANSRPSQLSGGQQQRVAVARALSTQPRIIFADEPTANLDSVTAGSLIDLFDQLNRELGVTFLFSTHDHRLVSRARTILKMRDGQLIP